MSYFFWLGADAETLEREHALREMVRLDEEYGLLDA